MSLDRLYGPGAAAELERALAFQGRPAIGFEEHTSSDGSVRVVATWGAARMKIDCFPDRVHYATLESSRTKPGSGLYRDLCGVLPALFKSWGVERFTCSVPMGMDWKQMHLGQVGGWEETDSSERLVWEL